jgi:hypothetical protein
MASRAGLLPRLWKLAGAPFRPLADEAAWWVTDLADRWERACGRSPRPWPGPGARGYDTRPDASSGYGRVARTATFLRSSSIGPQLFSAIASASTWVALLSWRRVMIVLPPSSASSNVTVW